MSLMIYMTVILCYGERAKGTFKRKSPLKYMYSYRLHYKCKE